MTLSPGVRRLTLTGHVTFSVGWVGAVAVFVALEVAGRVRGDPEAARVLWLALQSTTWSLLVPLAFASLLTGTVLSLGTTWGLLRHYWVVFKLALTALATGVLLVYTRTVDGVAGALADGRMDSGALPSPLLHTGGGLVVLLLATILGVCKPRGMTRYGQRRQRRERQQARQRRQSAVSKPLTAPADRAVRPGTRPRTAG